jgi:Na+/proline symporter
LFAAESSSMWISYIGILSLVVSCIAYGIISKTVSQKFKTANDFFHTKDVTGGLVTLLLGNLTLGTGLVYNSTLASEQGILSLTVPLGVIAGYWLLYRVIQHLGLGFGQGLLTALKPPRGGGSWFATLFVAIMLLTYILLIGFEVFVSAELLSALVAAQDPKSFSAPIAAILLLIALGYTTVGGLRGVIYTDYVQLAAVVIMLILIFVCALSPISFGISETQYKRPESFTFLPRDLGASVLTLTAAAFLTAVTTQFYNVMNIKIGTNYNLREKRFVYLGAGYTVAACIVAFIGTGIVIPDFGVDSSKPIYSLLVSLASVERFANGTAVFFLVFGMVAVLLSTLDTALLSMAQTFFDDVWKLNSFDNSSKALLARARWSVVILGVATFVPCVFIYGSAPNLIPLLLCSIHAMTILAPLLVISAVFNKKFGFSFALTRTGAVLIGLFVFSFWSYTIWDTFAYQGRDVITAVLFGVPFSTSWILVELLAMQARTRKTAVS